MAQNKQQHFVPRCYLKPFSLNGEGAAINLFNIKGDRLIPSASVKGQCAKPYFYGDDLVIEKKLQSIEREYSLIVAKLQNAVGALSQNDLKFLRDFTYLQFSRTDMAIRRTRYAQIELELAVFEGNEEQKPTIDYSDRAMTRDAMILFSETVDEIRDLKVCLVRNQTKMPFIISDDPAVFTNRFHAQQRKPRLGGAGISNAGAMFFLPLTPFLMVVSYDGGVYTIPDKDGGVVDADRASDITALNELQYLKAGENLYFSDWSDGPSVRADFERFKHRRLENWSDLNIAIEDGSDADTTRYRVTDDKEERQASNRWLLHLSAKYPEPTSWFSAIRYRKPPRFDKNESGGGMLRRRNKR